VARPVPPPVRNEGPLALEQRPADARPPTLSGHAPTHVPTAAPPPRAVRPPMPPAASEAPAAARPSRPSAGPPMPLIIGGGVLVLALAVGSYFVFRGSPSASPAPSAQPSGGNDAELLKQLLDSQAQLAKKHLEDKDFRAAVSQAQEILQKDPNHAQARQVLDAAQKSLQDVDGAVAATRKALEAGDVKTASDGLSRIFALDPKNPAAAEFSTRLNQFFRGQAESARKEMSDAQRQADRTRQASAQADYGAASAVGRDAEALYGRGEFAQATRKFMESRDAYERARRAAEHAVKQPSAAPATTMVAVAPTLPPTTMAMVATPEPTPVTPSGPSDDGQIRELVAQYERAIETRDPGLLKTLKPDLSGKEQEALRRAAANKVNITVGTVQIQGDKATVMCARTDRLSDGKTFNIQQTLILARKAGRWVIQKIVSQQIGQ
jgi:tetratricopeptide (TPR) repeat protein